MITIASPYAIWVLKQASDKLPFELDEAARIDGASPLQLFRLVYLPLMTPSLVAVGTYALLLAWNEYLYAFLLLSRDTDVTLAVALGQFLAADDSPWELLMTTGLIYALPPAAIYYVFKRYMVGGLTAGAVKMPEAHVAQRVDCHGIRLVPQHREVLRHARRSSTASLRHRRRRVHGAGRAVGLRQVDAAADARGPRGDQRRHDRDRRQGRQRRRVEGPRHRDGVPELRALPAHDGARQHGLQPASCARRDPASIAERVAEAAKILNLDPYLDRYPRELSGGQRQRVAMGRAIVRDPKVFLFDEPLSNLDAKLRVAMRAEIKALHQRLKTTTVYVTHDQIEAMTMADRIVVMHDGVVEQIGTPLELYDRPDNLFVAQFIGSPAMNIVDGTLRRADGSRASRRAAACAGRCGARTGADGQAVTLGVRPEHLTLRAPTADGVPGEIVVVEPTGAETELLIQAGEAQIVLMTHGRPERQPGRARGARRSIRRPCTCSTRRAGQRLAA